jgi:hypothetical protein
VAWENLCQLGYPSVSEVSEIVTLVTAREDVNAAATAPARRRCIADICYWRSASPRPCRHAALVGESAVLFQRSPVHHVNGGSLAEIFVGRSAIR